MDEKKVREAIELIDGIIEVEVILQEGVGDINKALDLAIEALEKQLSKKPKKNGDLACSCGLIIQRKNRRTCLHYCHNCGQAIDWSE